MLNGKDAKKLGYVENDWYHGKLLAWGSTQVDTFRRSVQLFRDKYVTRVMDDAPSASMELGTLVHLKILEPEKFEACVDRFETLPTMRSKEGKEFWAKYAEEAKGRFAVDAGMYATIIRIANAVSENELAAALLSDDDRNNECAFTWTDEDTGLLLKCKADVFYERGDKVGWEKQPRMVHLKTAADASPSGFQRAVANFGYHRSAALYRAGVAAFLGVPWQDVRELFLVLQTAEPYEAVVYELSAQAIEIGARQVATALRDLKECIELDAWGSRWKNRVNVIELPKWAEYED